MADELNNLIGGDPVTLHNVKEHCRVDFPDDDSLIAAYLEAAIQYCEDYTGRQLRKAERVFYFDNPHTAVKIPRPPLISVESVEYFEHSWVTVPADDYKVDTHSMLIFSTWTVAFRYRVNYTAGYTDCPAGISHAIKLLVSTWYNHRENVTIAPIKNVPFAVEALLNQWRVSLC